MENSFYHNQIFGSEGGISMPIQQAQADAEDADNYDAEAALRCPRCECATPVAETCGYCGYDLVAWALSMTQASATQRITETMQEMRNGG